MRDYREYLQDILKSTEKIQRYTSSMDYDGFLADDRTFDAVVRNLEIIGEAVLNVPKEVTEKNLEIEWRKIGGLRNLLAHGYFKVQASVIWNIVQDDIPPLATQIEGILESKRVNELQSSVGQSNYSTDSSTRSIYPPQRERAAVILPIAYRLLEIGRKADTIMFAQETNSEVLELEVKDYKLIVDNSEKVLIVLAKDGRGVLIKATREE